MSRQQLHCLNFVALVIGFCSCTFKPNVPNGHIICAKADDCPSGYTCESVPGADAVYSVCCKDKGCASKLVREAGPDGSDGLSTLRDGPPSTSEAGTKIDGSAVDRGFDSPRDLQPQETFDTTIPGDVNGPDEAPTEPDVLPTDVWTKPNSLDAVLFIADAPFDTPDVSHVASPDVPGPDLPSPDVPGPDLPGPDLPPPDVFTPDAQGTCGSDLDCPTETPMCLKGVCARCTVASQCTGNPSGSMCDTTTGRCASCLSASDCTDSSKPYCGGGKCTACPYASTPNGCCANADCTTGGTGTVGTCGSAHTCTYTCGPATPKSCNGGCIADGKCCSNSECNSGGTGTIGTCNASHDCTYACDTVSYLTCDNKCLPKATNCCVDNDCSPVTLPNECMYQGCKADTTCGAKPRSNTTACANGAGMCDGAGNCVTCTTGQYRCTNSVLEECNTTHTGFSPVKDCGSAALCNPSGPTCYVCVPGSTCDPAAPHDILTCASDRMSVSRTNGSATQWCLNGEFVACRDVNDCTAPTNPCEQVTCETSSHTCKTSNKSSTESCGGNGTCDGNGRCNGPIGNSCRGTTPLTCQGVSCCQSTLVGGSYQMGRTNGTTAPSDDCPLSMSCATNGLDQPEHPARVSDFYLDNFEVTVGRFYKFASQYAGAYVAPGAGKNPHVAADTGWDPTWNSNLPANSTTLQTNIINCSGSSWEASTAASSPYPVNCVTWYEAFAFCVYDGGRLATEAEWEYAAAGGELNRFYPWGNYDASVTTLPINYYNNGHAVKIAVGSYPAGVGRFGQFDLLGSVSEWVLDGIGAYSSGLCDNCADLSAADIVNRGIRGGAWSTSKVVNLRSAYRVSEFPITRGGNYGFRCAHDKTQ